MADELRQAAEREFARLDAEESAREAMTGECSQERWDRYHLASAVMEANPADDGDELTPEWLLSEGWMPVEGEHFQFETPGGAVILDTWPADGEVRIGRWVFLGFSTKGHVRRLLSVLGVDPKE